VKDRITPIVDRRDLPRLVREVVEDVEAARPPAVPPESCRLCAQPDESAFETVVEFGDREDDSGMGLDLRRCPSCGQTYGYWFWNPVIHGDDAEEKLWRATPESVVEHLASRDGTSGPRLLFRRPAGIWVVSPLTPDDYVLRAAAASDLEALRLWLDHGGSANAVDPGGETALMKAIGCWAMATLEGREKVVRLLLDRGADVRARDREGRSALERARSWGRREAIVALLSEREGRLE
jgi:hypothetical protein